MREREWRKEFARRLAVMMEKYGWSQRELARRSDLSPTTINGYLNLRYVPSVRGVVNIAHAFKCDVSVLIDFGEKIWYV